MKKYFFIVFIGFGFFANAQVNKKKLLNIWHDSSKSDSARIMAIDNLIWDYYMSRELDSALYFANQYEKFTKKINNLPFYIKSHYTKGIIFKNKGEYAKSLANYNLAFETAQKNNDSTYLGNIYQGIASIFRRQKSFKKALEYNKKALVVFKHQQNSKNFGSILNNIGNIFFDQMQYDTAMVYYQKSFKIRQEINHKKGMASTLNNLADVYYIQNRQDLALEYYNKSLKLYKEIFNEKGIARSYLDMCKVFEKRKQYQKSILMINEAEISAKKLGNPELEIMVFNFYYKIYKKIKNNQKALFYHEKLLDLEKSFERSKTDKKLQVLEISRIQIEDSLKKVVEIRNLELTHQDEINRKNNIRNILLAIGVLILILSGVIYGRLQYKRKIEKLEALDKLRTKISSDLHDEVGGVLTNIALKLEYIKIDEIKKDKSILYKLSQESRKAMNLMSDVIWAIDVRKDSVQDLTDRMKGYANELFENLDIDHDFEFENLDNSKKIDPNIRQNIYLIFKECLNNIAKHSKSSEVFISLKNIENKFLMKIKDNGTGLIEHNKIKGQGMSNLKMRANKINADLELISQNGLTVLLQRDII